MLADACPVRVADAFANVLGVTVGNLDQIVGMLRAKRQELLDQLDAVDKAIAALGNAPSAGIDHATVEPQTGDASVATGTPIVPKRLKPRRVLDEAHKEALVKGRRRARAAREAAAGLAREMPGEDFVPALASQSENEPPRLVKKGR